MMISFVAIRHRVLDFLFTVAVNLPSDFLGYSYFARSYYLLEAFYSFLHTNCKLLYGVERGSQNGSVSTLTCTLRHMLTFRFKEC